MGMIIRLVMKLHTGLHSRDGLHVHILSTEHLLQHQESP
jgi:hypothetical protein